MTVKEIKTSELTWTEIEAAFKRSMNDTRTRILAMLTSSDPGGLDAYEEALSIIRKLWSDGLLGDEAHALLNDPSKAHLRPDSLVSMLVASHFIFNLGLSEHGMPKEVKDKFEQLAPDGSADWLQGKVRDLLFGERDEPTYP